MPDFFLGDQLGVNMHRALLSGAAYRKFHGQNRHAHDQQEEQIQQHECAAAVLADHIGELPDVADADRAACTEQNEAKTAS